MKLVMICGDGEKIAGSWEKTRDSVPALPSTRPLSIITKTVLILSFLPAVLRLLYARCFLASRDSTMKEL